MVQRVTGEEDGWVGLKVVKKVNPYRWLACGVENLSLCSDAAHVLNAPQAGDEVALFQGFWHGVLRLVVGLIPLVSCPWQREEMADAGLKIG